MNSYDNENQFHRILHILLKRKYIIIITLLCTLAPIIYYNETATPIFKGYTTLIYEQEVNPIMPFALSNRQTSIINIIEEIKSRSVAEDVAYKLPRDILEKIAPDRARIKDEERFRKAVVSPVQKSIRVESIGASDILEISAYATDKEAAKVLAGTVAEVIIERHVKIKRESASSVRAFIEGQLKYYQDKLQRAETELTNFKEKSEIVVLDKQAEELLARYTSAEVLYNTTRAERGSKESRLQFINEKISQERKDLAPSVTNVGSPWIMKLKENLVNLEVDYTELQLQNYSENHPRMVELKNKIEQAKKTLREEALKLSKGDGLIDPFSQIQKLMEESITLQIEIEALKSREEEILKTLRSYDTSLKGIPRKELKLARLMREKNVNEQTYMLLMQKLEEARISEAEKASNMRVIDEARSNDNPVSPKKTINIIIGLMLGLGIGFGAALLFESVAEVIETPEDIKKVTGWFTLASIPRFKNGAQRSRSKNGRQRAKDENLVKGEDSLKKQKLLSSIGLDIAQSEAYHILLTNTQITLKKENLGVTYITSSLPSEGKSTTSVNLAIALAKQGQRTLLVDLDLRKSVIHKIFDIPVSPGFTDFILAVNHQKQYTTGSSIPRSSEKRLPDSGVDFPEANVVSFDIDAISEMIHRSVIENLYIMPAGSNQGNLPFLIRSGNLKNAFWILSDFFDSVVIDGPPVLLVPEAILTATLCEQVLFVVRADKTRKRVLVKAHELLSQSDVNVTGAVFNNVKTGGLFYGKKSYYYYDYS